MSKHFMDETFLLSNKTATYLYQNHAAKMPIIDYHCHINPKEIADDHKYETITQPFLAGDHYKWRLMRANGVPEQLITGNASDREKFDAWAKTLDKAIGNPLYHWTHLELKRYFDYHGVLGQKSVQQVWDHCNKKLLDPSMSVRGIIKSSNVRLICTTDDPVDNLLSHCQIAQDESCEVKVLPGWRPDKLLNIDKQPFGQYIQTLSEVSGVCITDFDSLCEAVQKRMNYFELMGCRSSDHGIDFAFYMPCDHTDKNRILKETLAGGQPTTLDVLKYKTEMLLFLARQYAKRGWVMQMHYAAVRNVNSRMFKALGADTGFDTMGNALDAVALGRFLDALDSTGELPKIILFSLNQGDNEMLGTLIGCFQQAGMSGKLQQGVPWWFNDTKTGMEQQLISFANLSLLGNFIGMLTDSRSYLSYVRHEYFRRILCNLIGSWVEKGEYPNDLPCLGQMVEDICFNNVNKYFAFDV